MNKIDSIVYYDLEDNVIASFNDYKDCAKFFNTTIKVIACYISRRKLHYPRRKKLDKSNHTWGYLEVFYEDND